MPIGSSVKSDIEVTTQEQLAQRAKEPTLREPEPPPSETTPTPKVSASVSNQPPAVTTPLSVAPPPQPTQISLPPGAIDRDENTGNILYPGGIIVTPEEQKRIDQIREENPDYMPTPPPPTEPKVGVAGGVTVKVIDGVYTITEMPPGYKPPPGYVISKDLQKTIDDAKDKVAKTPPPTPEQEAQWKAEAEKQNVDPQTYIQIKWMALNNISPVDLAHAGQILPRITTEIGGRIYVPGEAPEAKRTKEIEKVYEKVIEVARGQAQSAEKASQSQQAAWDKLVKSGYAVEIKDDKGQLTGWRLIGDEIKDDKGVVIGYNVTAETYKSIQNNPELKQSLYDTGLDEKQIGKGFEFAALSDKFANYRLPEGTGYDIAKIFQDIKNGKLSQTDAENYFGKDNFKVIQNYNDLAERNQQAANNYINYYAQKYNISIENINNLQPKEITALIEAGADPKAFIFNGQDPAKVKQVIDGINNNFQVYQDSQNKIASSFADITMLTPQEVLQGMKFTDLAKWQRDNPSDTTSLRTVYGDKTFESINQYNQALKNNTNEINTILNSHRGDMLLTPQARTVSNALLSGDYNIQVQNVKLDAQLTAKNDGIPVYVDTETGKVLTENEVVARQWEMLTEAQREAVVKYVANDPNKGSTFASINETLDIVRDKTPDPLVKMIIYQPITGVTDYVSKVITLKDAKEIADKTYAAEINAARDFRKPDGSIDIQNLTVKLDVDPEFRNNVLKETGYADSKDLIDSLKYYNNITHITASETIAAGTQAVFDILMLGGGEALAGAGAAGLWTLRGIQIGAAGYMFPSTIRTVIDPSISGYEKGIAIGGEVALVAGTAVTFLGGKQELVTTEVPKEQMTLAKAAQEVPTKIIRVSEPTIPPETPRISVSSKIAANLYDTGYKIGDTFKDFKSIPDKTINGLMDSAKALDDAIAKADSAYKNIKLYVTQELPDTAMNALMDSAKSFDDITAKVNQAIVDARNYIANDLPDKAVNVLMDLAKTIDDYSDKAGMAVSNARLFITQGLPDVTINKIMDAAQAVDNVNAKAAQSLNEIKYLLSQKLPDRVVNKLLDAAKSVDDATAKTQRALLSTKGFITRKIPDAAVNSMMDAAKKLDGAIAQANKEISNARFIITEKTPDLIVNAMMDAAAKADQLSSDLRFYTSQTLPTEVTNALMDMAKSIDDATAKANKAIAQAREYIIEGLPDKAVNILMDAAESLDNVTAKVIAAKEFLVKGIPDKTVNALMNAAKAIDDATAKAKILVSQKLPDTLINALMDSAKAVDAATARIGKATSDARSFITKDIPDKTVNALMDAAESVDNATAKSQADINSARNYLTQGLPNKVINDLMDAAKALDEATNKVNNLVKTEIPDKIVNSLMDAASGIDIVNARIKDTLAQTRDYVISIPEKVEAGVRGKVYGIERYYESYRGQVASGLKDSFAGKEPVASYVRTLQEQARAVRQAIQVRIAQEIVTNNQNINKLNEQYNKAPETDKARIKSSLDKITSERDALSRTQRSYNLLNTEDRISTIKSSLAKEPMRKLTPEEIAALEAKEKGVVPLVTDSQWKEFITDKVFKKPEVVEGFKDIEAISEQERIQANLQKLLGTMDSRVRARILEDIQIQAKPKPTKFGEIQEIGRKEQAISDLYAWLDNKYGEHDMFGEYKLDRAKLYNYLKTGDWEKTPPDIVEAKIITPDELKQLYSIDPLQEQLTILTKLLQEKNELLRQLDADSVSELNNILKKIAELTKEKQGVLEELSKRNLVEEANKILKEMNDTEKAVEDVEKFIKENKPEIPKEPMPPERGDVATETAVETRAKTAKELEKELYPEKAKEEAESEIEKKLKETIEKETIAKTEIEKQTLSDEKEKLIDAAIEIAKKEKVSAEELERLRKWLPKPFTKYAPAVGVEIAVQPRIIPLEGLEPSKVEMPTIAPMVAPLTPPEISPAIEPAKAPQIIPEPSPLVAPQPIPAPIPSPVPSPIPEPSPLPIPQPLPEPLPQPQPQTVPKPMPEPLPKTVPEPIPPTKPPTEQKIVIPPKIKISEKKAKQEAIIKNPPKGTVVFIQGRPRYKGDTIAPMFKVITPPYTQEQFFTTRQTPAGYKDEGFSGEGMAFRSIQILGGIPDKPIRDLDLGFVRINIDFPGGKPVISYPQDVDSNTGERSKTVGMGRGQIPLEEWEAAKSQGIAYEDFIASYKGERVDGQSPKPAKIVSSSVAQSEPESVPTDTGLDKKLVYQFGNKKVYSVNGEYIRDVMSKTHPELEDFTDGGNWKVYDKVIPENEYWVENVFKPIDFIGTSIHELTETDAMGEARGKGKAYENAHANVANVIEYYGRYHPELLDEILQRALRGNYRGLLTEAEKDKVSHRKPVQEEMLQPINRAWYEQTERKPKITPPNERYYRGRRILPPDLGSQL